MTDRQLLCKFATLAERFRRTPIVDKAFDAARNDFDAFLDELSIFLATPGKTDLSFNELHVTNAHRCEDVFHKLHDWTLTDWATAMGGECGEALNVVKKMRRQADDVKRGMADDNPLIDDLASEIADLIIYADLLATRAGINLGDAVRHKFNLVSEKRGSEFKL